MTCPYCERRVVEQFNPAGRCGPEEGQISVCAGCSGVCVFAEGVLRRINPEEFKAALENPGVRSMIAGIIRGLAQAKHLRS